MKKDNIKYLQKETGIIKKKKKEIYMNMFFFLKGN